jgi:hypothetical protein
LNWRELELAGMLRSRRRGQATYIAPELLARPLSEITPLYLNRERARLLNSTNPVANSEPPKVKKHRGIAFTAAQQRMVIEAATTPWCLRTFLEVVAATGCRRDVRPSGSGVTLTVKFYITLSGYRKWRRTDRGLIRRD